MGFLTTHTRARFPVTFSRIVENIAGVKYVKHSNTVRSSNQKDYHIAVCDINKYNFVHNDDNWMLLESTAPYI